MQQKEEDVEVFKSNGETSYFLKMHNLLLVLVGMY